MHGIIVLEGSDCTGKSTLAARLKADYNAVVIHATNRWPKRMWYYHDAILRKAIKLAYGPEKRLVVLDRHWPSELVYGPIFRPSVYNPRIGRMFDRILRRFKAQYVWCMPTPGHVPDYLKLYQQNVDPQHPYNEEHIRLVLRCYQDLYYGYGAVAGRNLNFSPIHYGSHLAGTGGLGARPDVTHYDMHGDNPIGLIGAVFHKLETAQRKVEPWQLDPDDYNVAGDAREAKVVLVGDRANFNKVRDDGRHQPWPFHDNQHSSYFLAQQLDYAGVREEDICIINSHDGSYDNSVHVCEWGAIFKDVPAVLLGNKAEDNMAHWFNDEVKIPHPSYAKRFNVKDYHIMLREAVYAQR